MAVFSPCARVVEKFDQEGSILVVRRVQQQLRSVFAGLPLPVIAIVLQARLGDVAALLMMASRSAW